MNGSRCNYDSVIIDKLFFDFDGENSYKGAKKFTMFLLQDGIKFKVNFSGEGFHIFVKVTPEFVESPKDALRLTQEKLLDSYNLKKYNDFHIVSNIAQLYRLPNTFNVRKGKYCIPLLPNDFDLGYDGIKDLAESPRRICQPWTGIKEIRLVNPEPRPVTESLGEVKIHDVEPCIKQILEKRNPGHVERFILVTWLSSEFRRGRHITKVDKDSLVREICRYIGKLNWSDYDERKTEYQVKNIIYKNINNMYSHEKRAVLGLCPGRCFQYEIDEILRDD